MSAERPWLWSRSRARGRHCRVQDSNLGSIVYPPYKWLCNGQTHVKSVDAQCSIIGVVWMIEGLGATQVSSSPTDRCLKL
ncbi:hypothetical protein TNCV_2367541 [Trichonephila clavipes]|nr:hypothetical protein TNCV_2367541 [Trichonephila clavipes]